jgi:uncharacterized protein
MDTTNYFIIPGLGNSGDDHWQTHFEKSGSNFIRIEQTDWYAPFCEDWIASVDKAISGFDLSTVVLIGHSLGCLTIIQWAIKYKRIIKGALLVGPSDLESTKYTFPISGFTPIPQNKINFKTIIVASADDPWVSIERAQYFAQNWGSEFINIGNAGHINTASGYGIWKKGLEFLRFLG